MSSRSATGTSTSVCVSVVTIGGRSVGVGARAGAWVYSGVGLMIKSATAAHMSALIIATTAATVYVLTVTLILVLCGYR